jgi:hypothetical protein
VKKGRDFEKGKIERSSLSLCLPPSPHPHLSFSIASRLKPLALRINDLFKKATEGYGHMPPINTPGKGFPLLQGFLPGLTNMARG